MPLIHYLRNDSGGFDDISDRVRLYTFDATMNAEEASVAASTIVIDDPNGDLSFTGLRRYQVVESDVAASSNTVVYIGYVGERVMSRGPYRNLAGRIHTTTMYDLNTVLERRVFRNNEANRPAETDVARMQWMITNIAAAVIEDSTYLSTANPVAMDAVDYRGQRVSDLINDCMQASGKNAFMWYKGTAADGTGLRSLWYGNDDLEVHSSILRLSNDLDDIDFDLTIPYEVDETTLTRDPSRVYSGLYLTGDFLGSVYAHDDTIDDTYRLGLGRDATLNEPNIKSLAKAQARADRYLGEYATETDVVKTVFYVPSTHVNHLQAGMRVPFKATHLDGYENFTWMRCLNREVQQHTETEYRISVELAGPGVTIAPPTPDDPGGGDPNFLGTLQVTIPTSGSGSNSERDWGDTQPNGTVYLYEGCQYRFVFTVVPMSTGGQSNGGTMRLSFTGLNAYSDWVSGTLTPKPGSGGNFDCGYGASAITAFEATMEQADHVIGTSPEKVALQFTYVPFAGHNAHLSTAEASVYYVSGPDPRF